MKCGELDGTVEKDQCFAVPVTVFTHLVAAVDGADCTFSACAFIVYYFEYLITYLFGEGFFIDRPSERCKP